MTGECKRVQARVDRENNIIQRLKEEELTVDLLDLRRDPEGEE